jgi:hypothetical protein
VYIVRLAGAERVAHLLGRAGIQRDHLAVVDTLAVQGELEHGERLTAVVDQDPGTGQLVPAKRRIRRAGGDQEAVAPVDLGEMHDLGRLAALERREARRDRRLDQVHAAVGEAGARHLAGRRDGEHRIQSFGGQKARGLGGDQRAVERRIAGEHDPDLGHDGTSQAGSRGEIVPL